jgi:hypothetical protein
LIGWGIAKQQIRDAVCPGEENFLIAYSRWIYFSQITITPATESRPIRGRHRIEDLISESAPGAFSGEQEWGKAQGKEVW